MKVATKFIPPLNEEQTNELKKLMKEDTSSKVRIRAHSIILNAEGTSINEISRIYKVDRDTVSCWLDKWKKRGFEGLRDKARGGRPKALNPEEKEIAIELIYATPQSSKTALAKLKEQTGKTISQKTLKRYTKSARLRWKRVKKAPKEKPEKKSLIKPNEK